MRNLLRYLAARHGAFLLAIGLLFAGFQFLICAAVSSIDVSGALATLLRSLPPFFQSVIATQFLGGFSAGGLLAFGWNHPVAHALGAAAAIALAAYAVAGESEAGAMELLLSQPLSRTRWLAAQVGFALAALAALSVAGVLGTAIGQRIYRMEPFAAGSLARLALGYTVLQAASYGITLLFSVSGREGGRVASAGFLVVVASYFAQAIGRLWSDAAFVLPWTLHHYFSPQAILVEHAAVARPLAVLGGVLAATLALAFWGFRRRDLP